MRKVLSGDGSALMASIFDPISARIADELGYEAGLMGGSLVSHVVLGAPDLIVLTLTELAEQVHRASRASRVPIIVDGDHGYGNALSVMRTIEEMDAAGAAGIMVEDTLLPRPYGTSEAQTLIPFDESVGKMKAAVKARGDSDLVVLGRTGAASMATLDEAVARFRAFENAGVDAIFIPGVRSREELDRISDSVKLPIVSGGVAESLVDAKYLASRRVKLYASGHQVFAVAVNALYEAMKAVREGKPPSTLPGIAPKALFDRVLGAPDYAERVRSYLGGA